MANQKYILESFEKEKRRRQLQKTKKVKVRQTKTREKHGNDWLHLAEVTPDEWDDSLTFERIMPLEENDRRKAVMQSLEIARSPSEKEIHPDNARVVELSPGGCRVFAADEVIDCVFRGSLLNNAQAERTLVTVGDRVIVSATGYGGSVIEEILPRKSELARMDVHTGHLRQVIAANIDQLIIIASWRNPDIWPELIDRYLITSWKNAIDPLICVNKIDLASSLDEVEDVIGPYRSLDIPIILTSAENGAGIPDLRQVLSGKTSALTGLSGAGKSSLLSMAFPGFTLKKGEVNDETGQGRHTTTQAVMLPIGSDGFVIDTPGIKEFGLVGLSVAELSIYFPEIQEKAAFCRFKDCSHRQEPDCAVNEAIRNGEISISRYKSFITIQGELT